MSEDRSLKDFFLEAFQEQANHYAIYYQAPIYLVGSVLTSDNPRDIDVRVVLTERQMYRHYGKVIGAKATREWKSWMWRRAADQVKRSRQAVLGMTLDFQIQSEEESSGYMNNPEKHPRVRIDIVPDWVLNAGKKDE